jgi:hypothetical protein
VGNPLFANNPANVFTLTASGLPVDQPNAGGGLWGFAGGADFSAGDQFKFLSGGVEYSAYFRNTPGSTGWFTAAESPVGSLTPDLRTVFFIYQTHFTSIWPFEWKITAR